MRVRIVCELVALVSSYRVLASRLTCRVTLASHVYCCLWARLLPLCTGAVSTESSAAEEGATEGEAASVARRA